MSRSKSSPEPGQHPRLAISPGEPAGIGPDICIAAHTQISQHCEPVYYGSISLFEQRAGLLGKTLDINDLGSADWSPGAFNVHDIQLAEDVEAGQLNTANAAYVIDVLTAATRACTTGEADALVTGPINKAVINDAGMPFSGHTEWLQEKTGTDRVVMMLASRSLRVALVTTHLPLSAVPAAITRELVIDVIRVTNDSLKAQFGIDEPRILVCGLNPHAGESGHLGTEEIEVITPALSTLLEDGINVSGPVPADTAFTPASLELTDVVVAMYHDQGLPVLKASGFGDAVNVTLGMPIIRTSVDHGTALDIAGSGKADAGSIVTAVEIAAQLATQHATKQATQLAKTSQ